MGIRNICVEGNSNNIIRCIKGELQPSWSISNMVEEICITLSTFERVHVVHEYREANSFADWLANEVVKRNMTNRWITSENISMIAKGLMDLERIQGRTCVIIN